MRWQKFAMICGILLLCLSTILTVQAQGDGMAEVVKPADRDQSRWGDAVCNDGTPFAFTVQESPSGSTDWVIHLQGGGFCADCMRRNANLTTTIDGQDGAFVNERRGELFSRDETLNPTFYEANFVLAHYCSSDLWSGTKTEPTPVRLAPDTGWYFAGRLNVQAMMEVLTEQYGLDDANPETRVLFAGSSAGGVGVLVNADLVAGFLPQTAAADRLKLVNDAGFTPDFSGLRGIENADEIAVSPAYDLWGSQLNPACEQAQVDAGERPANCILGAVSYPFIAGDAPGSLGLPYLVQQSQLDTAALSRLMIRPRLANDRVLDAFREASLAALDGVAWAFSGGEPYHTLLPRDQWRMTSPDGVSFRDLLTRFWQGTTPEQVIWS